MYDSTRSLRIPVLSSPASALISKFTLVNLQKSYLDLYSTYFTYVTHSMQLCAAKHNKEKKSISTLLISLICVTFRPGY